MDTKDHVVDVNRTTDVLMPETDVKGGLSLPNKERLLFRIPENKSVLGLDVLARAKKASKGAEEFKVSLERSISAVTSMDEDEKSSSFESENYGSKFSLGGHSHASRRYRRTSIAEASELTNESRTEISVDSTGREASTAGSSSSFRTHDHIYHERVDERRGHHRQRMNNRSFTSEKKHRRHEHPPRTPVGFDLGDGRHEWEDTPLRESRERHSVSHRSRYPSRSPMLAGASPYARLVSPYQTPRFAGAASPWDSVAPSPEPIRASGASSKRASGSRQVGRSHQPTFSVASNSEVNDNERGSLAADQRYEITDEMLHEMDYNADREWYDREENNTMFDSYNSSLFQGDDTFQKKEAELANRLTRDEDARKVILLVHDTKPPFLDAMEADTKHAEPVMLIKDPTSDMAIISRKGSSLVREIRKKQSMNKSRQ